jgi:hypothetical protein
VARLGVFLAFSGTFDFVRTGQIHGSEAYDTYAVNILKTGVFGRTPGAPDAAIPPLYGYALAGIYGLLGRGYLQVALFNIALDVVAIALLADVGRRLFPRGDLVGPLAGLAMALYPYLVFQTLSVIDTSIYIALLHVVVWLIVVLREHELVDLGLVALAGLAGLAFGFATLTRPVLPVFAILVVVWFGFRRNVRQTLIRLTPVAVVATLITGAWTWRNYQAFGTFVPLTTTTGSNFWQGNNPLTVSVLRAGYDVQWTSPEQLSATDPRSPQADAERFALSFHYLQDHPQSIPELLGVKFLVLWSVDVTPNRNPSASAGPVITGEEGVTVEIPSLSTGDPVTAYSKPLFDDLGRTAHRWYWGILLVAAIFGSLICYGRWRDASLVWFLQLATTLVYVVYHPATRYRVPSDPLLFVFSASAIVWLGERLLLLIDSRSSQKAANSRGVETDRRREDADRSRDADRGSLTRSLLGRVMFRRIRTTGYIGPTIWP